MITLEDVKKNPEVQELVIGAQKQLDALGYTEHSVRHVSIVSNRAGRILETLGYDKHRVELAKIAWAGNANEAQLEVEAGKRSE